MRIEVLFDLIKDASRIARLDTMRDYGIDTCMIKKSELARYLKVLNVKKADFLALERAGLIRARRKGPCKNSPLEYSMSEINKALLSKKIKNLMNKDYE